MHNLFTERLFKQNVLAGHNVRIIGHTGVGKTTRCISILREMGLRTVVLAAPNTDPFLRLGGLPHVTVVETDKFLDFVRSPDISNMQVLYIDEFARGTREFHQQAFEILNAVAGVGRMLMGIPVPNLLSVITTDNPAENDSVRYDVAVLEHAIETRFHVHLWMEGSPDHTWLASSFENVKKEWAGRGLSTSTKKGNTFIGRALVSWWEESLDEPGKLAISPRVLEYMGRQVLLGCDPALAVPFGVQVPIHMLREKLAQTEIIDWDMVRSNPTRVKELVIEDPSSVTTLADLFREADTSKWVFARDLLYLIPFDLRHGIVSNEKSMTNLMTSFDSASAKTKFSGLADFYKWMGTKGSLPSPISMVETGKERAVKRGKSSN